MTSFDDNISQGALPDQPPGGAISFLTAPDSSRLRYGIWKVPEDSCRGTVVLLHGRTEFIEKHFETIADLLARGLSVFTLDWRGQGLSDTLNGETLKGHVGDYLHYVEDLEMFMTTKVAPATQGPLFIVAHSMGGHVALRYCHDHPGVIRRAVLCAPLVQLEPGRAPGLLTRLAARVIVGLGFHTRYVPGHAAYWSARENFPGNPLTSDERRYRIASEWIKRDPNLAVGPPTIGWLGAMFRSISEIHRPGYGAAIETPILMIAGERDTVVSAAGARRYCDLLPHGSFLSLPEAQHEILHEREDIRAVFWSAFDRFLDL